MPIFKHKFRNHKVNSKTKILILGTYNPDIPEGPTFFYGRPRNFLWQLLPGCYGIPSLKKSSLIEKQNFMAQYKIDFTDLIETVNIPTDKGDNYLDTYIDRRVENWKDVIALINKLSNLKEVYFTRKTFAGIPNIYNQILKISNHCNTKGIRFCMLISPARYANSVKQNLWINTIINQSIC